MKDYQNGLRRRTAFFHASFDARRQGKFLEVILSLSVVFILSTIAITQYNNNTTKAMKTEFSSTVNRLRNDQVINYAWTGRWTDTTMSSDKITEELGRLNLIHDIKVEQGNFILTYKTGQGQTYTESERLVKTTDLQPTLYWVCGYEKPRNDEVVLMPNPTNAPVELLSHLCR